MWLQRRRAADVEDDEVVEDSDYDDDDRWPGGADTVALRRHMPMAAAGTMSSSGFSWSGRADDQDDAGPEDVPTVTRIRSTPRPPAFPSKPIWPRSVDRRRRAADDEPAEHWSTPKSRRPTSDGERLRAARRGEPRRVAVDVDSRHGRIGTAAPSIAPPSEPADAGECPRSPSSDAVAEPDADYDRPAESPHSDEHTTADGQACDPSAAGRSVPGARGLPDQGEHPVRAVLHAGMRRSTTTPLPRSGSPVRNSPQANGFVKAE